MHVTITYVNQLPYLRLWQKMMPTQKRENSQKSINYIHQQTTITWGLRAADIVSVLGSFKWVGLKNRAAVDLMVKDAVLRRSLTRQRLMSTISLTAQTITTALHITGVQKTGNWYWFCVLKNWTIRKFDNCMGGFPTETACNLQFKL